MAHIYRVEIREACIPGHQMTADVIRDDGRIVRSGMWPEAAAVDCALLTECSAQQWPAEKYHAERAKRMQALRQGV